MKIDDTRLRIEIKRALCCVEEKMSEYALKASIGHLHPNLMKESGILVAYIESMRYMLLETAELDVDIIAWQSDTTVRYTFNSLPNLPADYNMILDYNVLVDVGEGDTIKITSAGTNSNNGEFTISAVGGTSSQLTSLDVNTIAWQNDFTVRYSFNGTPDLSSIVATDRLICTLAANDSNNGDFRIITVNDGSDYVDVINVARPDDEDDEATDSTAECDITRPIDFIEAGNSSRTDATDDEASDSPAVAIIKFATRNYTDSELEDILEHINVLCKNCKKAYAVRS